MEVMAPLRDLQHFGGATSSPYVSAPPSPKGFADPFDAFCWQYTSAPTSPARAAAVHSRCSAAEPVVASPGLQSAAAAGVPFLWEATPGTPKHHAGAGEGGSAEEEFDFAFAFSGELDKNGMLKEPTAADELFEEGRIRPLKPPPRMQYPAVYDMNSDASSPQYSPRSPKERMGWWSPRHRGRGGRSVDQEFFDPFAVAMAKATGNRGRERTATTSPSISHSRSRKGSRSLSPLRRGGWSFFHKSTPDASETITAAASTNPMLKGGGSKKWRLKDFFLFRSASEGRATGNRSKDPLRKYTLLSSFNKKVTAEDLKASSFRSKDRGDQSVRRATTGGPLASLHELHYATNRAASEEMKKKTALPYRQGIFSCVRFNPAINSIARGFGSGYSFSRRE